MESGIILGVALSSDNRKKTEEALQEFQNIRFIPGESPTEAKRYINSEPVSLILVEMSSVSERISDFCRFVKSEISTYIPLIIVTDSYRDKVIEFADAIDCDDIITSHFKKSILKIKLKSFLKMKEFFEKSSNNKNELSKIKTEAYPDKTDGKDFSDDVMLALKAGIQAVDCNGKIVFENEAAKLIVGSAIGRNADEFYHSQQFMTAQDTNLHLKEKNFFDEVDINTYNGHSLVLQKMKLRQKDDVIFQVLLIKDTEKKIGQDKIDHGSLKSFLGEF
ncbi:MAG: hypothetical protein CSB55_06935 [Candidatus Cloacimonadota bacterium]|nr:MAG: hypothetical protein CSB55_06935 [Candidatus Cloacimonadota bacterium]